MRKFLFSILMAMISVIAIAQIPAFPGAEGHGRYTTGGREGKIIHVTTLTDNGSDQNPTAGSLRAAVQGNDKKIIVFDVGGVIALKADLTIGANTTILGQTAPAPGITLRYYTLLYGGNNIIVRFIRSRRGEEKDINDGADATWTRNKTGIIIDHCSFSWSIDEVASFYDNNNFTMQWCTIAESLVHPGHSKGPHGYGGIWGGKLASFHHNLIAHVANRSPRFNGARYNWTGYYGNKLYSEYKWENAVQSENVDFRNCIIFNCGDGCYGGPGGGQINMVNNYFKSGQVSTSLITTTSVANSTTSEDYETYWTMFSRYYISGNRLNSTANADWGKVKYDNGTYTINGVHCTPDPNHYYGSKVNYVKNSAGTDCVSMVLNEPAPTGEVTTHTAVNAYDKVLDYAGASLNRDDVDARYATETRNGKATYKGSATSYVKDGKTYSCTPTYGRIDKVSDVKGYTEANFGTGSRAADFDADNDGMADAWEQANGGDLDPNAYTVDPAKYYTNIEVYANSLVQDIMLSGNADADEAAKEYYPAYTKADGTKVEVINTLGVDLSGGGSTPSQEAANYFVMFDGSDIESAPGFFTYEGKHNFNSKFQGTYGNMTFNSGLKLEGSTVISFNTTAVSTVTIVQSTWSDKTIKFDGSELPISSATTPQGSSGVRVYTLNDVAAGNHKIARQSSESGLFYLSVDIKGTSGVKMVTTARKDDALYNVSGQRVGSDHKGIAIKNGKIIIVR